MSDPRSDNGSDNGSAANANTGRAAVWERRVLGLLVYALMIGAVVLGMQRGRRWALTSYQGEVAREDWEDWRTAARKQAEGDGPVQRKVPTSGEPPALVLMRDYYWQCLGGALLVTSALAFSMIYLFFGMLGQSQWQPLDD